MSNSRNCLSSPPRILTRGRFSFLAILIAALCLSSYVSADNIYQTKTMGKGIYWGSVIPEGEEKYWSGEIPSTSTANNYFVGQGATALILFRTLGDEHETVESDEFPDGNTLWLGYNTDGTYSTAQGAMALKAWNFTINDLQLGNSIINQAMKDGTANMLGAMKVNKKVTFMFDGQDNRKINVQSAISGAGEITLVEGSDNENLIISSANNAFTGTLNVSQNSSVVLEGENAMKNASSIVLNSGSALKLQASQTLNNLSGSGTIDYGGQALTLNNTASTNTAFSGVISGTGAVTKTGAGTLELSGANTYTGTTTINGGTLIASKINSIGSGALTINNATYSTVSGTVPASSVTITGDSTFNSSSGLNVFKNFSGSGTLTLTCSNSGYLALNSNNKATNYTGVFIVGTSSTAGALKLETDNALNAANGVIKLVNGRVNWDNHSQEFKTLEYYGGNMESLTGTLTLSNEFKYDSSTALTVGGVIAGAGKLTKEGSGTLTLSGANTYSGGTTISGGTLKLTGAGTLGTGAVTVGANAALEIAYDTPNTPVNISSVTMTTGDVFNAGSAFKVPSGTVTFGTTDVALNNLSGGEFENGQITVPSSLTVAGKLTLNNDQLTKFIGSITATEVKKTGLDTLQLCFDAQNAVSIYSLVVSSGRVDLKGYMLGNISVEGPDAVFSPGNSVGEAKFGGGYELKEGATLLIEVDGSGADTLVCDGFVLGDGTVKLVWQNDEIPFFATCDIITSTSDLSDVYENLLHNLDFRTSQTVQQLYEDGYITLALTGANNNIITMSIDRNAVPEPSTWALLLLGAAGLLYVRKRTRK